MKPKVKKQPVKKPVKKSPSAAGKTEEKAPAACTNFDGILKFIKDYQSKLPAPFSDKPSGAILILKERFQQKSKHGIRVIDDVANNGKGQLLHAATKLINSGSPNIMYPTSWDPNVCKKMDAKTHKEKLIIAGALIAAEIDRIQALEK